MAFFSGKKWDDILQGMIHGIIPSLEAIMIIMLIGMVIGEEKDIDVTFPEEYGNEDLAGKPVVFHVVLHKITKRELPELNDEFIADATEFNTLAEYRADLEVKNRKAVEERNDEAK